MEKSIKINISGIIFQIHEDAYELLRDYLQSITARLSKVEGGSEMIDDIEARIAEIFQSKPSWQTAVISKEEIEELISTMGSPEDIAGDLESETYSSSYRKQQGKLYRNTDNSIIGGVCSGISDYTGIEVVWIRLIFILFTIVYLSGLLVYVVLWIALPGTAGGNVRKRVRPESMAAKPVDSKRETTGSVSAVGNAFNEIFRAFGKFFIILFRIILAIIGVSFIVAGFTALFSFLFVSLFNSTMFFPEVFEDSLVYLPNFLYFIADPALSVWLTILVTIVIALPLLALIYWGIRMTFQFKAKDLMFNVIMLIIWVLSCVTLIIISFTQGISFSDSYRTTSRFDIPQTDTLNVRFDDRVSSLDIQRQVSLPFEPFSMYLDEDNDIIYVSPELNIYESDDDYAYMEVLRYSSGHSRSDAIRKAEKLEYDVNISDGLIELDEYFTLPEGQRWSGAFVKIRLYIPENMVIYFDEDLEDIMHDNYFGCGLYSWEAGGRYWKMTDGVLEDTD